VQALHRELLAVLAVLGFRLILSRVERRCSKLVAVAVAVQLVVLAVHQSAVLAVQMLLVRLLRRILPVAVAVLVIRELSLVERVGQVLRTFG
jgi:predicted thioredoxin/glutaredoxin